MCALFFFLADTDIKFLQSSAQTPTELEMREKGRILHIFFSSLSSLRRGVQAAKGTYFFKM